MTSKPKSRAIPAASLLAVKITTRSGVFARDNASSTSQYIARARSQRLTESKAAASLFLAFRKSLTGSRTVFIDYKLGEPPCCGIVRHEDICNLNTDCFISYRCGKFGVPAINNNVVQEIVIVTCDPRRRYIIAASSQQLPCST